MIARDVRAGLVAVACGAPVVLAGSIAAAYLLAPTPALFVGPRPDAVVDGPVLASPARPTSTESAVAPVVRTATPPRPQRASQGRISYVLVPVTPSVAPTSSAVPTSSAAPTPTSSASSSPVTSTSGSSSATSSALVP